MSWYGYVDENSYTNVRNYFSLIPNSDGFIALSNSNMRTYLSLAAKNIDNAMRNKVTLRDDYEYKLDNSKLVFPVKDELTLNDLVIEIGYKIAFDLFLGGISNSQSKSVSNVKRERVNAKDGEYEIEFDGTRNVNSDIILSGLIYPLIQKYTTNTSGFYYKILPVVEPTID